MIGELNSGDFASLAGGLLRDPGAAAGVEQAAGLTRDWSSDPLSAQRLSGLSGRVDLKVGTLSLVDGLIASNAHIVANLSPGLAVLDSLDAELLGGRLAGKGSASAASSGVGISFDGDLTGVALQQLGAEDGAGRIAAKADFKIAARSEGADAGTLAASLAGNAEIRVSAGEISALSPHAVAETARAVLAKEAGNDPASIAAAFDKLRAVSGFGFEAAVIPVKIDHGQIRLDPVTLKGGDADLLVDGSLDLSKWAGGGVFQLSPHKVPGEQTSLPAVSLAYSGPLATLFDAAPEIDVGALLLELIRRSEQAAAVPSDAIPLIGIAPKPAVGAAANPASGFVGPKAAPLVADPGIAGPAGAAPAGDGNLSSDAVSVDASDAADATAAAAPAGNAAAKLLGGDTAKTPAVIKPKKIKRRPAQKPASIFSDLPFDIFGNSQKLGGPVVKPPKKPLTTVIKPFFVPSNNR